MGLFIMPEIMENLTVAEFLQLLGILIWLVILGLYFVDKYAIITTSVK